MSEENRRRESWFLGGILLIGFLLRVWGIGFGLPHLYHPDEADIVHRALAFGAGDPNPHFFVYPSFYMYLLFLIYGFYFLIGYLFGVFHSVIDFQNLFFRDPTTFYLLGRFLTVLFGSATIWVMYRVGKNLFNQEVGLFCALLLAFSPLNVRDAHYAFVDIPMIFFILAALFFIDAVSKRSHRWDYLWAGVFIGLGTATKYLPILLSFPLLIAHFINHRGRIRKLSISKNLILSFSVIGVVFFITSPFCLLDFPTFWQDVFSYSLFYSRQNFGDITTWKPVIANFHHWEGIPFLIVFVGGLLWFVLRYYKKRFLLLFSFPIIYFVGIGIRGYIAERYLLPILPFLILWGSKFIYDIIWSVPFFKRKKAIYFSLGLLLIVVPTQKICRQNYLFCQKSTQTLAKEWIEANIPPGAAIVLEGNTAPLSPTKETILEKIKDLKPINSPKARQMTLKLSLQLQAGLPPVTYRILYSKNYLEVNTFSIAGPKDYHFEDYRKRGAEYFVVKKESQGVYSEFYRKLFRECTLLKIFSPKAESGEKLERLGPDILIYKTKKLPAVE